MSEKTAKEVTTEAVEMLRHPWLQDGGPAFPVHKPEGSTFKGMTLRDYFAAQAIPEFCKPIQESLGKSVPEHAIAAAIPAMAQMAYMIADAMLAERAK